MTHIACQRPETIIDKLIQNKINVNKVLVMFE
jgi:hypothetical protein